MTVSTFSWLNILLAGVALASIAALVITITSTRRRLLQLADQLDSERKRGDALVNSVIPLGVSLSAEKEFLKLLERILDEAISVCNADGGTLYLRTSEEKLEFVLVRNDRLKLAFGGSKGKDMPFPPLDLNNADGTENHRNIASHTVHTGRTVNIHDVYHTEEFDFTGPKDFDKQQNYRTRSMLCVPLKGSSGDTIGVIQIINARSATDNQPMDFIARVQDVIESMSIIASAALVSHIHADMARSKVSFDVQVDRTSSQVSEITETEFFIALKGRVSELRKQRN